MPDRKRERKEWSDVYTSKVLSVVNRDTQYTASNGVILFCGHGSHSGHGGHIQGRKIGYYFSATEMEAAK